MRKRITFAFLLMFACLGLWANSFPQSGYTAGQSASIMKAHSALTLPRKSVTTSSWLSSTPS